MLTFGHVILSKTLLGFLCSVAVEMGPFTRVGSWLFKGPALILRNTIHPSLRHFMVANGNPNPSAVPQTASHLQSGFDLPIESDIFHPDRRGECLSTRRVQLMHVRGPNLEREAEAGVAASHCGAACKGTLSHLASEPRDLKDSQSEDTNSRMLGGPVEYPKATAGSQLLHMRRPVEPDDATAVAPLTSIDAPRSL